MSEWRSIDSAPRDGTTVLLYWPSYAYEATEKAEDNPHIDIGWWTVNSRLADEYYDPKTGALVFSAGRKSAEQKQAFVDMGILSPAYFTNTGEADCYGQAQIHNAPTHWMPLPEPPQ